MASLGKTLIIAVCVMSLYTGCTEEQKEQGDKIVSQVQAGAEAGKELLESPAGAPIPADWKLYGLLAYGIISSATNAWQNWRTRTVKKTLTAVVKGVENAEDQAQTNPVNPVKVSIEKQMREARILDQADRIVDKIKLNI